MNETQQRIKAYQAALPRLRERVVAVALLLAMSISMMTTASVAWLTISRAPAVVGVNTTIAANGNLEIALVDEDGKSPDESKVGDSAAAEGQSVVNANLTWGNLVNLSDTSYGLENLVMRPAQLNRSALATSPLFGAVYNVDGRIERLSSSFGFGKWDADAERFMIKNTPGVRAISSVTLEAVGFAQQVYEKEMAVVAANLQAGSTYIAITQNGEWMKSLSSIMGTFMTAKMNAGQGDASLTNPTIDNAHVKNLTAIFEQFIKVYNEQAEAMVAMLNFQLFLQNNSETGSTPYTEYTVEMLLTTNEAALKKKGLQATGLNTLQSDLAKLEDGYAKLLLLNDIGTVKWADSGIDKIVNNLMNVGTCTLDGTPINNIGASNASGYLDGNTHSAVLTNGALYNFEKMNGAHCEVENLSVSAKVKRMGITVPATISVNITTNAPTPDSFTTDLEYADSLNQGAPGVEVAQDTYGLAIDLWVRTNASGSYLTLEGNILTKEEQVRATGKDANGNTVELFTLTLTETDPDTGENASYTVDVYQKVTKDENDADVTTWYNATNHAVITLEEGQTPVAKMDTLTTVIGYEGENRVWNEKDLPVDATTQGSGSCYVYYADTPEDQARSLALLDAFNVAFVDAGGRLVATAGMDVDSYYAENGRVIVPLVLDIDSSIDLGEDYTGETTYAIMALEKNTPTWLTAIVYLDGTKLTNDEVLAAADIQGQLNIQFGTSQSLQPIDNETLENKELKVSASIDKTEFDYDTATEPMTTNITLNIDGDAPNKVTAFFLRKINDAQGSREGTVEFTKQADGTWTAPYTFTAPGNYILRTVQLDGQEYVLSTMPEVKIRGFTVDELNYTSGAESGKHASIMTAGNSFTVDLELKFATDDEKKLPKTVQGRFLNDEDGSAVNVNFTYNPTSGKWTGSATFLSSGDYTMQFLVLDGEYSELDPGLWKTASVTLGMKVAVFTTSPHKFKYVPSEMADNEKLLYMQVKIMDNTDAEMPALSGVKLSYNMKGSGTKRMDTDLTWKGTYYEGELTTTGPGIWQFSNVTVDGNTITAATTSPTFTIQSPEPPEYHDHKTNSYQYAPNNDAFMHLEITNSAAAVGSVQALIVNTKDGSEKWVDGAIAGNFDIDETDGSKTACSNWNFPVPKDANGYQDGNWQLTEVKLWDVFAADGTPYTEEKPLVIDVSDTNNKTKVVSRVTVTFAEDKSANFGKDTNGNVTGVFMQSHTISGLNVKIEDFEKQPIRNLSDVKLSFVYGNDSKAYGGYTSTSLTNAVADFTIELVDDGSGINFAQNAPKTIQYAGSYATTFSFKVSGISHTYSGETLPANAPKFTVSSVTPSVKITAAQYASKSGGSSSFTDTSTTVYYKEGTESSCGITYYNYTPASVVLTLNGYGNASGAELKFTTSNADGKVHLYEESQRDDGTSTDAYQWTGNGGCTRYMGYWESKTGSDDKAPAGTLTATKLVLTHNGESFTVDIPDITINNPS